MEDTLEKKQRVNLLMDCYEDLLTDKQKNYLDYYYHQDYSLAEIALEFDVSRNAVFDTLKKSVLALEKYESKLGLLKKHEERLTLISKIEEEKQKDISKIDDYLEMLKGI